MTVLVAGSGKMARNVGLFLLQEGQEVHWVSGSRHRVEELRRWVGRRSRRILRERPSTPTPQVVHLTEVERLPPPEVLFEVTRESLDAKRSLVSSLEGLLPEGGLVVSGTSSILPEQIHPRCVGLHLFYPVELSMVAEVVFSAGQRDDAHRISALARTLGFDIVEEDRQARAFLANRLLLPLQAEAVHALTAGIPPEVVDEECARQTGLPTGPLSLMDSVGGAVVEEAVRAYRSRMPSAAARDYEELSAALARGGPLAGPGRGESSRWEAPLPLFREVFANTCRLALAAGLATAEELHLLVTSALGADEYPAHDDDGREALARAFEERPRCYLDPRGLTAPI